MGLHLCGWVSTWGQTIACNQICFTLLLFLSLQWEKGGWGVLGPSSLCDTCLKLSCSLCNHSTLFPHFNKTNKADI